MYVKGSASLGVGNKGPDLKLSVGRTAGKWTFKGWSSTEFSGGWKAGVSGQRGDKLQKVNPWRKSHVIQPNNRGNSNSFHIQWYYNLFILWITCSSISITYKMYHVMVINHCSMLIFRFYRSIIYSSKQISAILMFMMKTVMES